MAVIRSRTAATLSGTYAPLVLTLPLPPNMANNRVHWRTKNRERQAYLDRCDLLWSGKLIPPAPVAPFASVTLSLHLFVHQPMDDDNALARVKWAADWLVTRRFLTSDKRPACCFTIPTQTVDRKNPRLEITITPANSLQGRDL